MNERRVLRLNRYAMAALFLLCLVLGGGTAPSLAVDGLLQAAMIVVSVVAILTLPGRPAGRSISWFIALPIAAVALQFLPLPSVWLNGSQGVLPEGAPILEISTLRITSLVPGRTLESLSWVIAHGLLLIAVLRLPASDLVGLIPFFLLGVFFNLLVAFFQFMAKGGIEMEMFSGVSATAGFFANPNHFSTLAIISVPLSVLFFLKDGRWVLLAAFLLFLSIVLLAAMSRFGVVGAGVTLLGSGLLVLPRRRIPMFFFAGSLAILAVVVYGASLRLASEGVDAGTRSEITRTTLTAIGDNLLFGVGYGGFVTIYPAYEPVASIGPAYINHAHNDFLELALEGGVIAILLMILGSVLLLKRTFEMKYSPFHRGIALAIILIVVHSILDYPLRTMALSVSFVLLIGLLFEDTSIRDDRGIRKASMKNHSTESLAENAW